MNRRIRFQQTDYVLVGDSKNEGAITPMHLVDENLNVPAKTVLRAMMGDPEAQSYAHLFPDGRILRYGEQIGTMEDITYLDESAAEAA